MELIFRLARDILPLESAFHRLVESRPQLRILLGETFRHTGILRGDFFHFREALLETRHVDRNATVASLTSLYGVRPRQGIVARGVS